MIKRLLLLLIACLSLFSHGARITVGLPSSAPKLRVTATQGFEYSPGDSAAAATFTRASTATYRDSGGGIASVASGALRDAHYAYDGSTYVRSILLEESRTNLLVRSQEFD